MPRLQGYRERTWWKLYDTVDIGVIASHGSYPSPRWFTSFNVGNIARTNMQMGGQLTQDCTFVILSMYATCPIDEVVSKFTMEFVIGNRPCVPTMTLREWLLGFRPKRPLLIPVRQNFYASGGWVDHTRPANDATFDVVVHVEGLLTRDVQ